MSAKKPEWDHYLFKSSDKTGCTDATHNSVRGFTLSGLDFLLYCQHFIKGPLYGILYILVPLVLSDEKDNITSHTFISEISLHYKYQTYKQESGSC